MMSMQMYLFCTSIYGSVLEFSLRKSEVLFVDTSEMMTYYPRKLHPTQCTDYKYLDKYSGTYGLEFKRYTGSVLDQVLADFL